MNYFYTEYWMEGEVRGPMGTANHLSVPNQVFPTTDGSVVIIAPNDEMWRRCAEALGDPSLDRPEYKVMPDRLRLREELVAAISEVTRELTSNEIVERLAAVKVNVAKVNNVGEAARRCADRGDRRCRGVRGRRPAGEGGREPVQSVRDADDGGASAAGARRGDGGDSARSRVRCG